MSTNVAIQGIQCSIHQQVALYYSGRAISTVVNMLLMAIVGHLFQHRTDFAVRAIQNSEAAAILPNYTLVQRHATANRNINKSSNKLEVPHHRGAPSKTLNSMCELGLNLYKIQSIPKGKTARKYLFFVDVTFGVLSDFKKAIPQTQVVALKLNLIGSSQNRQP